MDRKRIAKFSTQDNTKLDAKMIEQFCPTGMMDVTRIRSVFSTAGIPTPNDDWNLFDAIEKNIVQLNKFLSNEMWKEPANLSSAQLEAGKKVQSHKS